MLVRLYIACLKLFPKRFRVAFGAQIEDTFRARVEDARARGRSVLLQFWVLSFADLFISVLGEQRAVLFAAETPAQTAGGPEVTVSAVPPSALKPLSPDAMAVSRRQFLNRAWGLSFVGFLGFFGMGSLSFLWPKLTGGFGTKIDAGNAADILKKIGPDGGFQPLFNSEGRFWLTYYDGDGDASVYAVTGAVETKVQALYRKCVHLGCSVPFCTTSALFECPCHGSKYRMTGEYFEGPAPRGLDRFPVVIEDGNLIVDTSSLQVGPPRGTSTWEKFASPQGDFCQPRAG